MTTRTRLVAALLAVGVLAPAAAQAAPIDLQGAPTLRQTGERQARVEITTAKKLRTVDGKRIVARIGFSDDGRFALRPDGRHGKAYAYKATIRVDEALRTDARYTVRLIESGEKTQTLRLRLIDAR